MKQPALVSLFIYFLFFSCKPGKGLFGSRSGHEKYAQKLKDAGLTETALGRQWLQAADKALNNPQSITLPYKEVGYFAAERPRAAGLRFTANQGEKLRFRFEKNPTDSFAVYVELWRVKAGGPPGFVREADTPSRVLNRRLTTMKPISYAFSLNC